jgi:hypothetical protein
MAQNNQFQPGLSNLTANDRRSGWCLLQPFEFDHHRYTGRMKRAAISATSIAAIGLATCCSMNCAAQERPDGDPSEMSREQWQAHVKAAREQADIMRREHKSFIAQPPTPDEIAEEASKRVLKDDSLQPGDIISTDRGLFRFEGSPDSERKPDDFVRIR